MRKSVPMSEDDLNDNRVTIIGGIGLLGISVIILSVLLTSTSHDLPQSISMIAVSIAIPVLACCIYLLQLENTFKCRKMFLYGAVMINYVFGFMAVIVGIGGAIWHMWDIAGIAFSIAVSLSLIFFLGYFLQDDFAFEEEINKRRTKANEISMKKSKAERQKSVQISERNE